MMSDDLYTEAAEDVYDAYFRVSDFAKVPYYPNAAAILRERFIPRVTGLQPRVDEWMNACFGVDIKRDQLERADRFIEEALELAQTIPGFGPDRAHALVDYVFGRPTGEQPQEVGGVMLTLAALCNAAGIDMMDCAETELARVWTKVYTIRAKQAAKPTGSALPIAMPSRVTGPHDELIDRLGGVYARCKLWPEKTADGQIALMELRNLVPDAAAAIASLQAELAEANAALWQVAYKNWKDPEYAKAIARAALGDKQ